MIDTCRHSFIGSKAAKALTGLERTCRRDCRPTTGCLCLMRGQGSWKTIQLCWLFSLFGHIYVSAFSLLVTLGMNVDHGTGEAIFDSDGELL